MKHQQHAKLKKPDQGFFARNEISFLGTTCDRIQATARSVGKLLGDDLSICYIDADHASADHEEKSSPTFPFAKDITDKISFLQFNTYQGLSAYERRAFLQSTSLVLVNGNHEKAEHQMVFVDPKKEASLVKRKQSLSHVLGFIHVHDETDELPNYIKDLVSNHDELPVFSMKEEKALSNFLKTFVDNRTASLNGLILGGGKSTRMGTDKMVIDYHGLPQHVYLNQLLSPTCKEVFVSCRADQKTTFPNTIEDSFVGLGAYGGILSAFQKQPNAAWIVVACDIPLLDKETIEKLVANRNPNKVATCFYNSETKFPEPLITIWEPRAYPILLNYLSLGYSCPRKVLINSEVEIVKLKNENVLMNANTLDDQERAKTILAN